MRPLHLLPLLFCACLPTGTGNPLQDATPGLDSAAASDAGAAFDAAASDGGPSPDTAPSQDSGPQNPDSGPVFDASFPDAGDASCPDAGPAGCGVTGGPSCECLAGDELSLGNGLPLALADHPSIDGRLTLLRQRADMMDGEVLEALVVDTDAGSTESTVVLATRVDHAAAAAAGDSISIAYVSADAEDELQLLDAAIVTGAASPSERRYVHSHVIGELAVARAGTMSVTAFVSATSDEPSDGQSVFVHRVVDGVADPGVSPRGGGGELRALAISAAPEGWLLSYATSAAVFTQLLDASGMAVGVAQEITSASFVSVIQLVARDEGFILALDGSTPAVHFLDAVGASTSSTRVEGRIIALEWASAGHAMTVRSDTAICSSAASRLIFERTTADLMALHEPVQVAAGDFAAITLVDDAPWVASSAGSALAMANACVADD